MTAEARTEAMITAIQEISRLSGYAIDRGTIEDNGSRITVTARNTTTSRIYTAEMDSEGRIAVRHDASR